MRKLFPLFAFVAIVITFAACGDGNNPVVNIAPEGAIKGKFSVGAGQQVYFAKGNLLATTTDLGTTWSWAFAPNGSSMASFLQMKKT